jgi:hypothetical protein
MAESPATFLEALLPASLLMDIETESPATFLEALLPASLLMNIALGAESPATFLEALLSRLTGGEGGDTPASWKRFSIVPMAVVGDASPRSKPKKVLN